MRQLTFGYRTTTAVLVAGLAAFGGGASPAEAQAVKPGFVPFTLYANYGFAKGSSVKIEQLGVADYEAQLKRAGPKARIVPPDDGIKRGTDKTIYGEDNRRDFFAIPDVRAKDNARGVASISQYAERIVYARGLCTAFLIARDRAMTASHCVNSQDYRIKVLRFGDQFRAAGLLDTLEAFGIDDVEVWDRRYDFAVVRLKPNSAGELPGDKYRVLPLKRAPIALGKALYLVGHPSNDYKTYADNCTMMVPEYEHPDGKVTVGVDCDGFGGNSGSPVFDRDDHTVVGVFWGGQKDDRKIDQADASNHEFVVPMWRIAALTAFDHGTWPAGVSFVETPAGRPRWLSWAWGLGFGPRSMAAR